jgi:hypothetical protein
MRPADVGGGWLAQSDRGLAFHSGFGLVSTDIGKWGYSTLLETKLVLRRPPATAPCTPVTKKGDFRIYRIGIWGRDSEVGGGGGGHGLRLRVGYR